MHTLYRQRRHPLLTFITSCIHPRTFSTFPPTTSNIDKLLVANRGEIACRIITTAKKLNIPTVAVFSEADSHAKHVFMADEAYCIGPAAPSLSYLSIPNILDVATRSKSTAIHPGYGFLSENSTFASACSSQGVVFVGPPSSAIAVMGDKSTAKTTMASAGVPVVPGYHGSEQDEDYLRREAARIGYPVLIKAVLGGGGKGMKLASNDAEFIHALRSARRESAASFASDRVLLEKYIERPRHVEVQIMADNHGNTFFLAERDCSVQRRHQKVIEEAPAPGVTPEFRAALGKSAVAAARAVGYTNAGTVEFIVDSETSDHYFMEMNTRLQVEHPITEAITATDLVELQLRAAAGERLDRLLNQEALVVPRCHAVEARIYAENVQKDFLPCGGKVLRWRLPLHASCFGFGDTREPSTEKSAAPCLAAGSTVLSAGARVHDASLPISLPTAKSPAGPTASTACNVRIDSSLDEGDIVGVNYDPMIAKVIATGADRASALHALHAALSQLQISGIPTNCEFVKSILSDNDFLHNAPVDTSFIAQHKERLLQGAITSPSLSPLEKESHRVDADADAMDGAPREETKRVAAFLAALYSIIDTIASSPSSPPPWSHMDGFRLNYKERFPLSFLLHGSQWSFAMSNNTKGPPREARNSKSMLVALLQHPAAAVGGGGGTGTGDDPDTDAIPVWCVDDITVLVDGHEHQEGHAYAMVGVDGDGFRKLIRADWFIYSHADEQILDVWIQQETSQLHHHEHHQVRRPIRTQWTRSTLQPSSSLSEIIKSPMPGRVSKVFVKKGDRVQQGEVMCMIEAMKMEHAIKTMNGGIVEELYGYEGGQVGDGEELAVVVPQGVSATQRSSESMDGIGR